MQIIKCDPKWLEFPDSFWLSEFSKKQAEDFGGDVEKLCIELCEHFPQPGAPSHRHVPVIMKRGKSLAPHRHPEHLIIYYPIGHPARLVAGPDQYTPVRNTAVYLPPDTLHSVLANTNKKPRLSLALRWKTT